MWLDARDLTEPFVVTKAKRPRPMTLAINEHSNYFNVRASNVDLVPGHEVSLRIKQTQHVATPNFKSQSLATRRCRFANENPGKECAH